MFLDFVANNLSAVSVPMISIEQRCRCQQNIADKMFMDFKYTQSGSIEQINALNSFNISIAMWAIFLENNQLFSKEEKLVPISSNI